MLDDLLDLTADESALGKPVGNDLRERKVTIPLILALESGPAELHREAERFFSLDEAAADPEPARQLAAEIVRAGGTNKTRDAIAAYVERAKSALPALGSVPARAELGALADARLKPLGRHADLHGP